AVPARVVHDLRPGTGPVRVTLIAIDLAAYQRIAPGRLPAHPRGALLSPAAARELGTGPVTLGSPTFPSIRVEPSGRIDHFPGEQPGTPFVVVPYRALTGIEAVPSEVFVRGDPGEAALRGALQASVPRDVTGGDIYQTVQIRRDVLRGLTGAPMVGVVHGAFRDAALIGAGYGLLAVLLVLTVEARARGRGLAHLHVLGLSRRQSRALALVEIGPVLLCAAAAGWTLGLLLPRITGPVVDLGPYTGGFAVANHAVDPAALPALLGVLLLAAAAAVAVDRAFDTRHDLAGVLRTGE
ncbi:FtsX-like permease family protein, partial [Actinomadura fibrosa]